MFDAGDPLRALGPAVLAGSDAGGALRSLGPAVQGSLVVPAAVRARFVSAGALLSSWRTRKRLMPCCAICDASLEGCQGSR